MNYQKLLHQTIIASVLAGNEILEVYDTKFDVEYKGATLNHNFYADFVVFDKIILEVKAQNGLVEEHYKQTLNYLAISKMKLALLINFGNDSLNYNRVIL